MPKLSFVVPVYQPNIKDLNRCIDSLKKQSLRDFEVIFVMDGDDDPVYRLLYKEAPHLNGARIVIIPHGGAPKARNAGFEQTIGEYVVFWDCDSAIEIDAAKAWCDILDRDTKKEYGFIYSGYKFFDEQGAINSESFDPWLLRVSNYISMCFPFRRELFTPLDEELESLQDWDFWLTMVEKGAKGKYLAGYGFTTALPSANSISGKGCTNEMWLSRLDRVKKKHNIPIREVCVASIHNKQDAIKLAKLIDADYRDIPNFKPNHYKKIIQVGFSLHPQFAEKHACLWEKYQEKVVFWTKEDVEEIYNCFPLAALEQYVPQVNNAINKQFVEDKRARELMEKAEFKVQVLPFPLSSEEIEPMPETPAFLLDCSQKYGNVIQVIKEALPDVRIDVADGVQDIKDYIGMISFYPDRLLGLSHKRMILNGRHMISNINSPYMGFIEDYTSDEKFIVEVVEKVRGLIGKPPNEKAISYYKTEVSSNKYAEVL